MCAKPIAKLTESEKKIRQRLINEREAVFSRFPLLFTLLGTFGVVATFYGFERLIDKIDLFANNPIILLSTGLVVLIITGTLFRKLQ